MKLLAAAMLASALPAFGQDVREQLAAQLHVTCVANPVQALERTLKFETGAPIDTGKFCACADAGIPGNRALGFVAREPQSQRGPGSFDAQWLEGSYFFDGLLCYSKRAEWPRHPAQSAAHRSPEELRFALDRRKGRLWAAYNRALKSEPTLSGKVLFEIVVEPDGRVSRVTVLSSTLSDEKLLRELTALVKEVEFPAEPVAALVASYPIDFRSR